MKPYEYNQVFVLDTNKRPLPVTSIRQARQLLKAQRAAVWRHYPFTIILKAEAKIQPNEPEYTIKIDPGSKYTGMVVVDQSTNAVVYAMELEHHGEKIKMDMLKRKQLRSARRSRKTRHRQARFDNRTRKKGWLPPSLLHRVDTTMTWVRRFMRYCNVTEISVERVKFDMALMQDPTIQGKGYQQGALYQATVREYLLERHKRTCEYCGATGTPLEIEHIVPKSKGGSNNLSNLTIACVPCNRKKGAQDLKVFLAKKPELATKILKRSKIRLQDAAAVNSTRNHLLVSLLNTGNPVEEGSGSQTKLNRTGLLYPKAHWIDAACNGDSGRTVILEPKMIILKATTMGWGNRQMVRSNKYGFPSGNPKSIKQLSSPVGMVKTGDIVNIAATKGKYAGTYTARVSSINAIGTIALKINNVARWFNVKTITKILHLNDGYRYATQPA